MPDEYPRRSNDGAHLLSVVDQDELVAVLKRMKLFAKSRGKVRHVEAKSHSISMRCRNSQTRQPVGQNGSEMVGWAGPDTLSRSQVRPDASSVVHASRSSFPGKSRLRQ